MGPKSAMRSQLGSQPGVLPSPSTLPTSRLNSIHPQKHTAPHQPLAANLPHSCNSQHTCSMRTGRAHFIAHLALRNQIGTGTSGKRHHAWAGYTMDEKPHTLDLGLGSYKFWAMSRGIAIIKGWCNRRSGSPKVRKLHPWDTGFSGNNSVSGSKEY